MPSLIKGSTITDINIIEIELGKYKKIIILHDHHFSEFYYQIFGIDLLRKNGFHVEVWNFMPFIKNSEYLKELPPDSFTWEDYYLFNTKQEALRAIDGLTDDCCIICGVHYMPETYSIYRALSKKNIPYFSNLATAFPVGTFSKKQSLMKKIKQLSIRTFVDRFFYSVPFELLGIRPVDYIIAQGEKFFRQGYPSNEKSNILWGHAFDYDVYLQERDIEEPMEHGTGVFLDEYLPFHPDNADYGISMSDPEEYYSQLCIFFDHLEDRLNTRIIIAAHPRSHYEKHPDYFKGRSVIRGKTANLVKRSDFVIVNQCVALSYAVLFNKPMVFITSDIIDQFLVADPNPQWLADYFGKKLHRLDQELEAVPEKELFVDDNAYRSYRNDYIKKDGSKEIPLWQIFADHIKAMN